jgi:hypothetical protein
MKTFAKPWILLPALLMCSLACGGDDDRATTTVNGGLTPTEVKDATSRREGPDLILERTVTFQVVASPGADGFEGTIVARELAVRVGGGPTPFYHAWSTQTFTGKVIFGGREYTGSFEQVVRAEGPLNPNLAIDDPNQNATDIHGEWFITQTTGELRNLQGRGTLELTLTAPTPLSYQGEVSF